jgi:hypothetical protein
MTENIDGIENPGSDPAAIADEAAEALRNGESTEEFEARFDELNEQANQQATDLGLTACAG